jgi:hypothetical protein
LLEVLQRILGAILSECCVVSQASKASPEHKQLRREIRTLEINLEMELERDVSLVETAPSRVVLSGPSLELDWSSDSSSDEAQEG